MYGRISKVSLSISGLHLLFLSGLISISSSWSPSLQSGDARRLFSFARQLYPAPERVCSSALCRILRCLSCLLLIEIGDKPMAQLADPVIFLFGSTHLYVFNKLKESLSRKTSCCSFAALLVPQKNGLIWESELWSVSVRDTLTLTLAINSRSW